VADSSRAANSPASLDGDDVDVSQGEVAAEERTTIEALLQFMVQPLQVPPCGGVEGSVRFTSAEFHDGDGVGGRVKLCVRQVFEQATLGAAAWIAGVEGRLSMTVLQVFADDGRVIERELASTSAGTSARGFTCRKSVRLQSPCRARIRSKGTPFS
jgi:hypothetical protein